MYLRMELAAIAMTAIFIAGCDGPEQKEPVYEISVDSSLSVNRSGGLKTLNLTATADWTVESDSWISVSPASGTGSGSAQVISVTVADNSTGAPRTGVIEFSLVDAAKSARVSVSQEGLEVITISEFCSKSSGSEWYPLQGVITSIESYYYGDFYLKDDTGEILVYGMTSARTSDSKNDYSFSSLNLKEGDIVTLMSVKSDYRGEAQAGGTPPAYYLGHESGTEPEPVYRDFKASMAAADWMELPATDENDSYTFLHHGMKIGSSKFRNYSFYWDSENLVATWVAYPLTRKSIGYGTRTDLWGVDPLLGEDEQPVITSSSFKKGNDEDGNYVRGHQIPSADRLGYEANTKTFYGTNMTPQDYTFNAGIWAELESAVRTWAKNYDTDTLYVVTGCTVKDSQYYVYDNNWKKVTVPTGYFKAVLRLSGGEYSAAGFYFDHHDYGSSTIQSSSMSIDALEEKTGLDFFVNLPDAVAASVEAQEPSGVSWWWEQL